jgi:hypothetical protein
MSSFDCIKCINPSERGEEAPKACFCLTLGTIWFYTIRMETEYEYNAEKNSKLKSERGISFEEIIYYIENGHLLDVIEHPNQDKYASQHFYVIDVDGYVHLVPFVRTERSIFLKTIFPSRKHTKTYLSKTTNAGVKSDD